MISVFEQLSALFDIRAGKPEAHDLVLAVASTVIYCLARYMAEPLLRGLGYKLGTPDEVNNRKFCEQSIKFSHHLIVTVYGLWYMTQQPWFSDLYMCWNGYPDQQPVEAEFKLYYLIQIGFHSMSLVYHFFEERRVDYYPMLAHHVATVILVFNSYYFNWTRVGALIFLAHDFSDVFGCGLKLSVYLDRKGLKEGLFVVMMCVWAYTRMFIFPFRLITTAAYGHWEQVPEHHQGGFIHNVIVMCLCLLACLHYYWFYLFMQIAVKIVTKGADKAQQIYEKKQ
jgi:hypothetical protein